MQIFVINGGTSAFSRYEDFLEQLRTKPLIIERYKSSRDWKSRLSEALGAGYEVFSPGMPNKDNAQYKEWRIWFERFFPFMEDEIILIGHSLGGIFLAKYLSEEDFPKKIRATFLVAPPFESGGNSRWEKKSNEFALPNSLKKFEKQGGKIYIYHSKDDPSVPFADLARYQQALPHAHATIFEDKKHINQEEFPELVNDIKSL